MGHAGGGGGGNAGGGDLAPLGQSSVHMHLTPNPNLYERTHLAAHALYLILAPAALLVFPLVGGPLGAPNTLHFVCLSLSPHVTGRDHPHTPQTWP